ncbi:hypothetical protein GE21DRAFT_6542 [Neurospora crassa]|uniref:Uncharacterized protein n=1 Tax=Neurospora crassa (strain ATCC 24698 / 74-OR23-1A / CBS 708.71 / DSM 1257 / FGSC 987) TaxID=367110 RepID=Q7S842_NEUCR|nr:hypothetical protein NCU08845 [Neurospora crassa OR74A]EAA32503.1 hypothetical protein NCU08845 [Neurospora crassa OR74A]KHE79764.1 hypothetical protein GE21DRAFT_6542 [Neurospora crassa]|eukprot:XP_961739.1 hypothetical protein NCU08845 [Neurospora crassa OR74A]
MDTTAFRAIRLLPTTTRLICSATPTLNRLTDIRAFTTLIWEAGLRDLFKCPAKHDTILQDIFRSWGYRWWYLHPEVQASIVDAGKVALLNTGEVMRETQVLIVNRGMTTALTLPNGTISYPSAKIPPMKVWSVHLGHKTNATLGVASRFADYDSLRNVSVRCQDWVDDGYEITFKALLCISPLPTNAPNTCDLL